MNTNKWATVWSSCIRYTWFYCGIHDFEIEGWRTLNTTLCAAFMCLLLLPFIFLPRSTEQLRIIISLFIPVPFIPSKTVIFSFREYLNVNYDPHTSNTHFPRHKSSCLLFTEAPNRLYFIFYFLKTVYSENKHRYDATYKMYILDIIHRSTTKSMENTAIL